LRNSHALTEHRDDQCLPFGVADVEHRLERRRQPLDAKVLEVHRLQLRDLPSFSRLMRQPVDLLRAGIAVAAK
jgi:hypothetical protein